MGRRVRVTCAFMNRGREGYCLWLANSHDPEHTDLAARRDD